VHRVARLLAWPLALGLTLGLAPPASAADPVPSLNLRNFRPSTDPKAILSLEPVVTPGGAEWNAGAWFSYAHRLVELEDGEGREVSVPVRHQLSLDYVANIGLGEQLALGLALPTVLYQDGDDLPPSAGASPLPTTALGDPSLVAKASLIPPGNLGGFGLAALAEVTLPIGNQESYTAEASATGGLRLLAELGLIAFTVRATVGAHVRGSEQRYGGSTFGHDLPWGVGVTVLPQAFGLDQHGRWLWTIESRGSISLTDSFASAEQSPATIGLGARYAIGEVALVLGAEAPLDSAAGAPLVRGILGISWAPRFYDADGDGIEDEVDACPELAEDRDGFEDTDGCPDFDNDGDGVGDDDDRCPHELEDLDEHEDEDGCPDPDNDGDGVLDEKDACPNEPGPASTNPAENGCPLKDQDMDGIPDKQDKCPRRAEDFDAFEDEDGCPDRDNDRDGVPDEEDACPNEPGPRRTDPKLNGCPSPDRDGDTIEDQADLCPDEPEIWNGTADEDGCPDQPAQSLARFRAQGTRVTVELSKPITFENAASGVIVSPKSDPVIRALAQLLNEHQDYVLLVGVRPKDPSAKAEQEALSRSFALVNELRKLTYRDEVAESIGWSAVRKVPGAASGNVGFLVLSAKKPAPAPAGPPKPKAPSAPPKIQAP
jgi:OOP family OmpA-OmpF porin